MKKEELAQEIINVAETFNKKHNRYPGETEIANLLNRPRQDIYQCMVKYLLPNNLVKKKDIKIKKKVDVYITQVIPQ